MSGIFDSLYPSAQGGMQFEVVPFIICTLASLALGFVAACIFRFKNPSNKSFVVTLALLPAVVQLVIMLVNGNLGIGLAVMGAFTLVRFRSIPGAANEIAALFFSMAIGLATGMGFIAVAALFVVIFGAATLVYAAVPFGEAKPSERRQLKITIPETLNYDEIFDDIFKAYTSAHELVRLRTTNMGSLYRLEYEVILRESISQKAFLDELRVRNGNLDIVLGRMPFNSRTNRLFGEL